MSSTPSRGEYKDTKTLIDHALDTYVLCVGIVIYGVSLFLPLNVFDVERVKSNVEM